MSRPVLVKYTITDHGDINPLEQGNRDVEYEMQMLELSREELTAAMLGADSIAYECYRVTCDGKIYSRIRGANWQVEPFWDISVEPAEAGTPHNVVTVRVGGGDIKSKQ